MSYGRSWSCGVLYCAVAIQLLIANGSAELMTLEDFSVDPLTRGWKIFGDRSLFQWTNSSVQVTWDSRRPNSYFHKSLGTVVTRKDDFALSFDLQLHDVAIGIASGQPFTFQIAIGLLRLNSATNAAFARGTGSQSPNLVEFDYFPDSGFGATISPLFASTNSQLVPSFSFPLEVTPGVLYSVQMRYEADQQTLFTTMLRNGQAFGPIKDTKLSTEFSDFRVDTFSISSYSSAGAGGSILAHGTVDQIAIDMPGPAISNVSAIITSTGREIAFSGRTNFQYVLLRSSDMVNWSAVTPPMSGTGAMQTLVDPSVQGSAFYRVQADRP
jgi:hypothetical protein